jgi:hypothetical protein
MYSEIIVTVLILFGLGVFHGINPGMGWLFAVALGLQEQRRASVWAALLPLALGHALAIGITILLIGIIGFVIPHEILKWLVALILITFGMYKLFRNRHPRYGGMQVNFSQLTTWSFLMASAHGAGLMVLPFLFNGTDSGTPLQGMHHSAHVMDSEIMAHAGHANQLSLLSSLPYEPAIGLLVILIHTLGYLLIMGLVAVIVYEKLGLRLLQSSWFNIDLIWAFALIISGIIIPFI